LSGVALPPEPMKLSSKGESKGQTIWRSHQDLA
jgi:hypothetical protein